MRAVALGVVGIVGALGLFAAASGTSAAQTDVETASFDSVELRAGGHVTLRHGATPRVTLVEGDRRMTRFSVDRHGKLVIETSCHSDCPRNYRLRVDVVMPRIDGLAVSQGGSIRAEGSFAPTGAIAAAVNQGGTVDVRAIPARTVTAAVNQGGSVLVTANGALVAAVHQGGSIVYWGKPTSLTRAVSNGGSIHPAGSARPRAGSHDEASITYGSGNIDVDELDDGDDEGDHGNHDDD
jgi:hypothetical protein